MGSPQGGRQSSETRGVVRRGQTAFTDEHGLLLDDPEHSAEEDRFILLGLSVVTRLLVVVHCYRAEDQVIRIISARKADRQERRQYEERLNS